MSQAGHGAKRVLKFFKKKHLEILRLEMVTWNPSRRGVDLKRVRFYDREAKRRLLDLLVESDEELAKAVPNQDGVRRVKDQKKCATELAGFIWELCAEEAPRIFSDVPGSIEIATVFLCEVLRDVFKLSPVDEDQIHEAVEAASACAEKPEALERFLNNCVKHSPLGKRSWLARTLQRLRLR